MSTASSQGKIRSIALGGGPAMVQGTVTQEYSDGRVEIVVGNQTFIGMPVSSPRRLRVI